MTDNHIQIPPLIRHGVGKLLESRRVETQGDRWLAKLWLKDSTVPKSAAVWLKALWVRGGVRFDYTNPKHCGPTLL